MDLRRMVTRRSLNIGLGVAVLVTAMGCSEPLTVTTPGPEAGSAAATSSTVATQAATASATATESPAASAAATESPAASGSATSSAASTGSAASLDPPFAADNKIKPELESEDLTSRAKLLFEGIVQNDPAHVDPFWFPKDPFIPLKDVKDPGKYWDQLHTTYQNDVKSLHRKRKSWEGASFVGFKVGSTPKWVPPGDEVNKIGYYRSFHGKLTYEIEGKTSSIDVHTIISWQGKWYITHLNPFKKKKK